MGGNIGCIDLCPSSPQLAAAGDAGPRVSLAEQLTPLVSDAVACLAPSGGAGAARTLAAHLLAATLSSGQSRRSSPLERLRQHDEAGQLLRQVEDWLHRPPSERTVDVAAILERIAICRPRKICLYRTKRTWPCFGGSWSMSFAYPAFLILLILPGAIGLCWRRQGMQVALPFDHGQAGRSFWIRFLIGTVESLPAIMLAVAILLLAGPQRLGVLTSKRVLTNIEFCVDVSSSMTAKLGDGSRYDASMAAINDYLDYRRGDAFGLTFFGSNVLHWVPLTSDASAIRCSPPFMRPENIPTGSAAPRSARRDWPAARSSLLGKERGTDDHPGLRWLERRLGQWRGIRNRETP